MYSLQRRLMRAAAAVAFALAGAQSVAASADTQRYVSNARTPVVAQAAATAVATGAATAAATDAASPAPAANDTQGGLPWWVWLIIALLVIGLLLFFLNRKKDPTITTRGGGPPSDPNIRSR